MLFDFFSNLAVDGFRTIHKPAVVNVTNQSDAVGSKPSLSTKNVLVDMKKSLERGDGIEVFQPIETNDKAITLASGSDVKDVQASLSSAIAALAPNESISFTIDVDDTLIQSELGNIRVSRSEIKRVVVGVETQSKQAVSAAFGGNATVALTMPTCSYTKRKQPLHIIHKPVGGSGSMFRTYYYL